MSEARPETLEQLRDAVQRFTREREWQPFHTPKNLAMALCAEAGELLAQFQWLTPEQSRALSERQREDVSAEMADVLLYLVCLADSLRIDLLQAAAGKMRVNAERYPVDKARGNSRKYTEL